MDIVKNKKKRRIFPTFIEYTKRRRDA